MIEEVLSLYIGPGEAREVVEGYLRRNNLTRESLTGEWLIRLREEAERVLSGALGPSISTLVFQELGTVSLDESHRLSSSIRQISRSLRLSRQELAEANRQLAMLKEFSENIIESLTLGVATLDDSLCVTYWNTSMELITGVEKADALSKPANGLLTCLEPRLFNPVIQEGEITCRRNFEPSDFTYEDMENIDLVNWTYTVARKETVADAECWIVDAVANTDKERSETSYNKLRYWIGTEDYLFRKIDYTDKKDRQSKQLIVSDIRTTSPSDPRKRGHKMEMKNFLTEHKTVLDISTLELDVPVNDDLFSQRNLQP